jgi:hypothetical protein
MEKPMLIPLVSLNKNAFHEENTSLQDVQKVRPARPQPMKAPQAYPLGYGEDAFEVRTKLAGFWDILLKGSAVTVPHLSRHIAKLRQMKDSLGNFLS